MNSLRDVLDFALSWKCRNSCVPGMTVAFMGFLGSLRGDIIFGVKSWTGDWCGGLMVSRGFSTC